MRAPALHGLTAIFRDPRILVVVVDTITEGGGEVSGWGGGGGE